MSRCTIVGRGRRLRRIPMLVLRLAGSVSGCSLLGVFLQLCCQSMSWLGTNLVALVILANYRSYFLATERSLSTGVMRSRHRTSAALQRNLREDIPLDPETGFSNPEGPTRKVSGCFGDIRLWIQGLSFQDQGCCSCMEKQYDMML